MIKPQTQPNAADRSRIESATNDSVERIWRHTRENAGSLESEKHCRLIRDMLNRAIEAHVSFTREQLDSKTSAIAGLRTTISDQKVTIKMLESKLTRMREDAEV